jgi:hypothetical protein
LKYFCAPSPKTIRWRNGRQIISVGPAIDPDPLHRNTICFAWLPAPAADGAGKLAAGCGLG